MKRICLGLCMLICLSAKSSPVYELLERIDPGASQKFKIELSEGEPDFFELDQAGEKVVVRGNNYVSIATGINWYLKYYAGIHLSWNGMQAKLPAVLPPVKEKERREASLKYRYDFNYCTYSYSMAFWDWERWERELDWMAMHGINMALALTGMEVVWHNVLQQLGYTAEEIGQFIAGPGFLAWWHMNNLEGWGGPNPESWYERQMQLQHRILNRMREYGIEPVFPGYAGMLPHNASEKLGIEVKDPGLWCGYQRPAFLYPGNPAFKRIAGLYYMEMEKRFGKAKFYGMDPFHEGGNVQGIDLAAAAQSVLQAMKTANPEAVWVMQAWQANPRHEMITALQPGNVLILDLSSENRPMWGDKESVWYREKGFEGQDWLYCMLLNFGGNVGMYGRMDRVINGFYAAVQHPNGASLRGVGKTMEGIENNPVMYELLLELPWRKIPFTKEEWLKGYVKARYGKDDPRLQQAWQILGKAAYNCPVVQEGTTESVFCARPAEEISGASSWGTSELYYAPEESKKVAALFLEVSEQYKGNNNFEYDLADIMRQALADKGNVLQKKITEAYRLKDETAFRNLSREFLQLILWQDTLLATRPEFRLGTWLERAKAKGETEEEKRLYEWNARVQITTWGNRQAADKGGLRDYSHREWAGLLKDFYYPRWKAYFDLLEKRLAGEEIEDIDWYAFEEPWTLKNKVYASAPEGNIIDVAPLVFREVFGQ